MWEHFEVKGKDMLMGGGLGTSPKGCVIALIAAPLTVIILVVYFVFFDAPAAPEAGSAEVSSLDVIEYVGVQPGTAYLVLDPRLGEVPSRSLSTSLGLNDDTVEVLTFRVVLGSGYVEEVTVPLEKVVFASGDSEPMATFEFEDVTSSTLGTWEDGVFIPSSRVEDMTLQSVLDAYLLRVTIKSSPEDYSQM